MLKFLIIGVLFNLTCTLYIPRSINKREIVAFGGILPQIYFGLTEQTNLENNHQNTESIYDRKVKDVAVPNDIPNNKLAVNSADSNTHVEHENNEKQHENTVEHSGNKQKSNDQENAVGHLENKQKLQDQKNDVEHSENKPKLNDQKSAVENSENKQKLNDQKSATKHSENNEKLNDQKSAVEHSEHKKKPNDQESGTKSAAKQESNNTNNKNSTPVIPAYINKQDVIQSGALLRGSYVFLGLSVLTMMYFVFRSYSLRRGAQPPNTVRKYGVTARRNDLEMRPLELEDDDDDTLFEIGNQNNINR